MTTVRVHFQDDDRMNRADLQFSGCTAAVAMELTRLMWPQAERMEVME